MLLLTIYEHLAPYNIYRLHYLACIKPNSFTLTKSLTFTIYDNIVNKKYCYFTICGKSCPYHIYRSHIQNKTLSTYKKPTFTAYKNIVTHDVQSPTPYYIHRSGYYYVQRLSPSHLYRSIFLYYAYIYVKGNASPFTIRQQTCQIPPCRFVTYTMY